MEYQLERLFYLSEDYFFKYYVTIITDFQEYKLDFLKEDYYPKKNYQKRNEDAITQGIEKFVDDHLILDEEFNEDALLELDMDKLQNLLFPIAKKSKLFLSHYHPSKEDQDDLANMRYNKNKNSCYNNRAIMISNIKGYLNAQFKDESFVFTDDDHWFSADKTVKIIIETLNSACIFPEDYQVTQIHDSVYMALQRALRKQIARSSYFLFLDKDNSYNSNTAMMTAGSPWLALELELAPVQLIISQLVKTENAESMIVNSQEDLKESTKLQLQSQFAISWEKLSKFAMTEHKFNFLDSIEELHDYL